MYYVLVVLLLFVVIDPRVSEHKNAKSLPVMFLLLGTLLLCTEGLLPVIDFISPRSNNIILLVLYNRDNKVITI